MGEIDKHMIKTMIINSIRGYKVKFGKEFGEPIICCDSHSNWRRDIFSHYKANRKTARDASYIDWKLIFEALAELKADLKNHFPYKLLEVPKAEGDDIIAIVAKNTFGPVLIVGSDKDYAQLHSRQNVKQYSPLSKSMVMIDNPATKLKELIICGDKSDGIPNIKSPADSFVTGTRQKSIYKEDLASWVQMEPQYFCSDKSMLSRYYENERLIDFNKIPEDLANSILNALEAFPAGSKKTVLSYLIANRMQNLVAEAGNF